MCTGMFQLGVHERCKSGVPYAGIIFTSEVFNRNEGINYIKYKDLMLGNYLRV